MDNSISYEAATRKGEFSQKCRWSILAQKVRNRRTDRRNDRFGLAWLTLTLGYPLARPLAVASRFALYAQGTRCLRRGHISLWVAYISIRSAVMSAVQEKLTVRSLDENTDSFSSAAPSMSNASSRRTVRALQGLKSALDTFARFYKNRYYLQYFLSNSDLNLCWLPSSFAIPVSAIVFKASSSPMTYNSALTPRESSLLVHFLKGFDKSALS